MKLSARDKATLERIAAPGYTFSLQPPWPPFYEPQPYETPHPLAGKAFGLAIREKSWNGKTAEPTKNPKSAAEMFKLRVSAKRGVVSI